MIRFSSSNNQTLEPFKSADCFTAQNLPVLQYGKSLVDQGRVTSGLWASDAGRFSWRYGYYETIFILEGHAMIRCSAEQSAFTHVAEGSVVHFEPGDWAHWVVPEYVRKFFVISPPATLRSLVKGWLK